MEEFGSMEVVVLNQWKLIKIKLINHTKIIDIITTHSCALERMLGVERGR